ncbi:DUF4168 domain-containing protein [Leptothermofonsia sichuanensis E412]|uniref:DUF4168 domain-containing protein n=1 Tax=Leptothermofonsia sichuanensis TaxID=2917832 RepID=UPI001CA60E39|nr:DUF4168 domain-containing protein [Leptothermofonsia sichuanensis]QZZ22735.1 DUF4168 domain-containing protein [Leptothermofonsia sichuanensis E412]
MLSHAFNTCRKAFTLLLIVLFLWLVPNLNATGLAQESSTSTNGTNLVLEQGVINRSGLDPNNIPSEKVSQFVHACLQVVALIERREGELQGAETESESLRIEQEIEAEALAIIEKAGLTHQEYLQLLGLANTDPEFGERIAIQLQEATSAD